MKLGEERKRKYMKSERRKQSRRQWRHEKDDSDDDCGVDDEDPSCSSGQEQGSFPRGQHHRQKMAQQQQPRTLAATPTTQQHSQNDHTTNALHQVALFLQNTAPMLPIPRYTAFAVNGQGSVCRSGHANGTAKKHVIALPYQAFVVKEPFPCGIRRSGPR
jgi:hypothetical protein